MQRNETGAEVFEGKLERPSQLAGVHGFGTLAPSVAFFKSATPNREASIEEFDFRVKNGLPMGEY